MIDFVGGVSRSGKSLLASRLLARAGRRGWRWVFSEWAWCAVCLGLDPDADDLE